MNPEHCKKIGCPALTALATDEGCGCNQLDKPDQVGTWLEPVQGVSREQCRRIRSAITKHKEVNV